VSDAAETVHVHPSSSLSSALAPCVVFAELVLTSRLYMRNVSAVERAWLTELVPQFFSTVA
jgi:hypothetical protein